MDFNVTLQVGKLVELFPLVSLTILSLYGAYQLFSAERN